MICLTNERDPADARAAVPPGAPAQPSPALVAFFTYYNTEHRHSGIAMHTPAAVHDGTWIRRGPGRSRSPCSQPRRRTRAMTGRRTGRSGCSWPSTGALSGPARAAGSPALAWTAFAPGLPAQPAPAARWRCRNGLNARARHSKARRFPVLAREGATCGHSYAADGCTEDARAAAALPGGRPRQAHHRRTLTGDQAAAAGAISKGDGSLTAVATPDPAFSQARPVPQRHRRSSRLGCPAAAASRNATIRHASAQVRGPMGGCRWTRTTAPSLVRRHGPCAVANSENPGRWQLKVPKAMTH